tara:strand:+ start:19 stop:561 length:543 start_codon:yes stop_codon:yes gene_type:complete
MTELPKNIQNAIDKWKYDNQPKKPNFVKLNRYEDFDSIKYNNNIIEFTPGEDKDNKMSKLQFIHNSNVLHESINSCDPCWAPESYIIFDRNKLSEMKSIRVTVNGFLINEISSEMIFVMQSKFNLTPLTYHKNPNIYDINKMIFIKFQDYGNEYDIKREILFHDGKTILIKDDNIHYIRY